MAEQLDSFLAKSTIKAGDLEHRRKVHFNINKYNAVVPIGKKQFVDVELARERAKNISSPCLKILKIILPIGEAKSSGLKMQNRLLKK